MVIELDAKYYFLLNELKKNIDIKNVQTNYKQISEEELKIW